MKCNADFDLFLQTQLNDAQRCAVMHRSGPLLVVAGAGSGKTRVITARMTHLIVNDNTPPSAIVALTFTNKAAQEMKERMIHFLGADRVLPFVGTFHAYCLRFLKQHHSELPAPFVSVLDEDDQHTIVSGIIKRAGLHKKVSAKQVLYQISRLKNQSSSPEEHLAVQNNQLLQEIFQEYEREKLLSKCLDFDDLLLQTVALLKARPEILLTVQQRIAHVLVDEYQDTNGVQHELLRCIAQKNGNELAISSVCVVGDDDQSIYSWRGATVANILHFTRDFPGTTTVMIEQNYRSADSILRVANAVIKHNEHRNAKNLWSTRTGQHRVGIFCCTSEYQEADAVVAFMRHARTMPANQTHAVLYRAHYQSRAVEEALIKQGIGYTIIGGIRFYERREIKDLIAYLRLIVNPFDRTACACVINCPARGLGDALQEQFFGRWQQEPTATFADVAKCLIDEHGQTSRWGHSLATFVQACTSVSAQELPSVALKTIVERVGYKSYLTEMYDSQEAESKIENVKELIQAACYFESEGARTVADFLDIIALLQEKINTEQKTAAAHVVLMTLHAAKGLEFDSVAIIGLNEEVFPSARTVYGDDGLEEERRLLYVGITRAREYLLLTHARCRHQYGQIVEGMPSRFIDEIPDELVSKYDLTYSNNAHIGTVCAEFMNHGPARCGESARTVCKKGLVVDEPPKSTAFNAVEWRKNQPVQHPTFGIGMVHDIELKRDGTTYITARFKCGSKKVAAAFLTKV